MEDKDFELNSGSVAPENVTALDSTAETASEDADFGFAKNAESELTADTASLTEKEIEADLQAVTEREAESVDVAYKTDIVNECETALDKDLEKSKLHKLNLHKKSAERNVESEQEALKKAQQRIDASMGWKMLGKGLLSKLKESVISVVPVAVIVLIFLLTPIVDVSTTEIVTFVVSAIFLILGISLFNLGADLAMTPMGEHIGSGLTKSKNLALLLFVGFVMGVLITVAEPDLTVLAGQVSAVMNNMVLIISVGVGVGLFLLLSIIKVVFKKDLSMFLMFFYLALFAICALLLETKKGIFLPLAFDSGGVTTGPITVPFIMALGVGIASTVGGRKSKENSFGLIALCSVGPMIAVFILAMFMNGEEFANNFVVETYPMSADIGAKLLETLGSSAKDIVIALGLIVAFFLILQFAVLKLPKRKLIQIGIGILYTFVGLLIFFTSVHMGFMPIGYKLGQALATFNKPLLVVFSFVLGVVVVLAEPAVHVLNNQVEQVTNGAISKKSMLIALSLGVGVSIGLSLIRIVFDFSVLYYLIPGYIISLGLSFFVPKVYTAIAFDSGGVASGPLTASFILPFATGACSMLCAESSKVLELAFGIVAMVAMTPLITIQVLGFRAIASAKVKENISMKRIVDAEDEQIIEFM